MLRWDIYEVTTNESSITGVKFRGRVRKFCLERNINLIIDNDQLNENIVRFGVLSGSDISEIKIFIHSLNPDTTITLKLEQLMNPVLSKLKVNDESRYTI